MKDIIRPVLLFALLATILPMESCQNKPKLKAMIITGQNANRMRNYIALSAILRNSKIFDVEVNIAPAKGQDMSGFIVDFTPYHVVVLDYAGDPWPEKTRNNFVSYVRKGGGVVVYNEAKNAFPDWPEYHEMTGIGGSGNREESPGQAGSNGHVYEFAVHSLKPDHPILSGLPETWMHAGDEFNALTGGSSKNAEVIASAHSDTALPGPGRDQPVMMTVRYGKGRIFYTTLGNNSNELFPASLQCAGFITTFQRGAEWAASGRVTQPVPVHFPDEHHSLSWEFYEDISAGITPLAEKMQDYQTGTSTGCFTIFQKMIREDIKNPDKIREYNRTIRDLLESRETSIDCKKLLLREFAWMSDETLKAVYEKLAKDPVLTTDAVYALQLINSAIK